MSSSRSSAPPPFAPVLDAFAQLPASAHRAGIMRIAGADGHARRMLRAAWRRGDAMALAAASVHGIFRDVSGTRERVLAARDGIVASANDQTITATEAVIGLTVLWAGAVAHLQDRDLALDLLMRRQLLDTEDALPCLPAYGSSSNSDLRRQAADAVARRARSSVEPGQQGLLLLRLHLLIGSVTDVREHDELLLSVARGAGGGASLPLMIHVIDARTREPHRGLDGALQQYFEFLTTQPTDEGERLAFEHRRIYLETGVWPDDAPGGTARDIDRRYVEALLHGDRIKAADAALSRASATDDLAMAIAWNLQAIFLLHGAPGSLARLAHASRVLSTRVSLHPRRLPAIEATANDVLLGSLIEQARLDDALRHCATHPSSCSDRILGVFLEHHLRGSVSLQTFTHVVDRPDLEPMIAPFAGFVEPARRAIDLLLERSEASRSRFRRRRLLEVACALELFRGRDPAVIVRRVHEIATDSSISITLLWLSWAAAVKADLLDEWLAEAPAWTIEDETDGTPHLQAAIAETGILRGNDARFVEAVGHVPEGVWRDAILSRYADPDLMRRQSGAWVAVTRTGEHLESESNLVHEFEQGTQLLQQGKWLAAAAIFDSLAEDANEKGDAYRLRVLAGRSASVDPDGAHLAIGFLRNAILERAQAIDAWQYLFDLTERPDIALRGLLSDASFDMLAPDTADLLWPIVRDNAAKNPDAWTPAVAAFIGGMHPAWKLETVTDVVTWLCDDGAVIGGRVVERVAAKRTEWGPDDRRALLEDMLRHFGHDVPATGPLPVVAPDTSMPTRIREARLPWDTTGDLDTTLMRLGLLEEGANAEDRPTLMAARAEVLVEAGRIDDARNLATRIIDEAPNTTRAYRVVAKIACDDGRWDDATEWLEQAGRRCRDTAQRGEIYRELGLIYEQRLGDRMRALESYLVSFICESDHPLTVKRLEDLYLAMGRHKELAGTYGIAIETALRSPARRVDIDELLMKKAQIEFQYLRNPERAAQSLLQAIRLNPQDDHALDLLIDHIAPYVNRQTVVEAVKLHLDTLDAVEREAARSRPEWMLFID